jgi:hypothetical protein
MSDTPHSNRRAADRVRAFEPTHYIVQGFGEEQGIITNLSVKGCFIQPGVKEAQRGGPISVRIYLPLEPDGPAQAVWLPGKIAYYLPRVGIGVQFDGVTTDQRGGMLRLVEYYRTVASPKAE